MQPAHGAPVRGEEEKKAPHPQAAPSSTPPPRSTMTVQYTADPQRSMLAAAWYGAEDVRVVRVPAPDITDPWDAIVRNTSVTVCGSDLHMSEEQPRALSPSRPLPLTPSLPLTLSPSALSALSMCLCVRYFDKLPSRGAMKKGLILVHSRTPLTARHATAFPYPCAQSIAHRCDGFRLCSSLALSLSASQGHEAMGVVEKVGPQVRGVQVGDRVVIAAVIACGSCEYCRSEKYSLCETTNPSPATESAHRHITAQRSRIPRSPLWARQSPSGSVLCFLVRSA